MANMKWILGATVLLCVLGLSQEAEGKKSGGGFGDVDIKLAKSPSTGVSFEVIGSMFGGNRKRRPASSGGVSDSHSFERVNIMSVSRAQASSGEDPETKVQDDIEDTEDTEDISVGILTANNQLAKFLLEGDLMPSKTRNAIKCWSNKCRWPKGSDGKVSVPYTISSQFRAYERKLITSALRDMESQTCIRFVPRRSEYDYIAVVNKGGCYSALGKQGGRQELSLQRGGCITKGIIQHEFNHALGFRHEQTRSDRDQYVRINWGNMNQAMTYNFRKHNTDNLNTPYDYNSLMHYGRTAFSINGRNTIVPLSPVPVNIGQRQRLSPWDIRRIKLLYRC